MFYFFITSIFSEIKMNKSNRKNGFSQIVLLVIISFLAISLPIATKLAQKVQENRSSAAQSCRCSKSAYGDAYNCSKNGGKWECTTDVPSKPSCANNVYKCETTTRYKCINGSWQYYASCPQGCSGTSCSITYPTYYYYNSSTKSCSSVAKYNSLVNCKDGVGIACYGDKASCEAVNINTIGKCDTSKLYGCLNGSLSNEKYSDLTYTWTCGSTNCSAPASFCSTTSRPLGCPCQNSDSLCASGICSNKVCVSSYSESGCKYAGVVIPVGNSQCFNAFPYAVFGTAWSDMVKCDLVDGKPRVFIVKSYPQANCTGNNSGDPVYDTSDCTYGGTVVKYGDTKCFNVTLKSGVFSGSVSIRCINGKSSVLARYPRQNCEEGNIKADDKPIEDDDISKTKDEDEDVPNTTMIKYYYGSNCTEGSYVSYADCVAKTGFTCYGNKDICVVAQATKYVVWSKTIATCDSSSGNWKCVKVLNSVKKGDGAITFDDETSCQNADGCNKYTSSPPDDTPPITTICTANTVSTTECYDSTHLKKCDSTGASWLQGDQCATGQVCTNGACGIGTTGTAKLSFKIAFMDVKSNISCLDNFRNVALTVGKAGTDFKQDLTVNITSVGDTNSAGYAIFKAENIALGAGFSGATNVYVRIKGQVHSKMYYCTQGQSAKTTSQTCNIAIDGTINNLYNYPILAGDVDQNGIVNILDFGLIRENLFKTGCGMKSDLTGDSIVNNLDIRLFKIALEAKYDE